MEAWMDRSVDKRSLDVLSCEKQAWTSGLDDINMEEDYCKVCWVEGVGSINSSEEPAGTSREQRNYHFYRLPFILL